jgi:hypothetical protein
MRENICVNNGDVNMQPCMQCNGIKHAGALSQGWTVCPRCGAIWEERDNDMEPRSSELLGCGLMAWAVIIAITLIGIAIIKACSYGRFI